MADAPPNSPMQQDDEVFINADNNAVNAKAVHAVNTAEVAVTGPQEDPNGKKTKTAKRARKEILTPREYHLRQRPTKAGLAQKTPVEKRRRTLSADDAIAEIPPNQEAAEVEVHRPALSHLVRGETLDRLLDEVGDDAVDDARRERERAASTGSFAPSQLNPLPDEEDDEEDDRLPPRNNAVPRDEHAEGRTRNQRNLVSGLVHEVQRARAELADNFDNRRYPSHRGELLLEELNQVAAVLQRAFFLLELVREHPYSQMIDRAALRDVRTLFAALPNRFRPVVHKFYNLSNLEIELRYEIVSALKVVEAVAEMCKGSHADAAVAIGLDDGAESLQSFRSDGSTRSQGYAEQKELFIDELKDLINREVASVVESVTRNSLGGPILDKIITPLRTERAKCIRIYKAELVNRWRKRAHKRRTDGEVEEDTFHTPAQTPGERLRASHAARQTKATQDVRYDNAFRRYPPPPPPALEETVNTSQETINPAEDKIRRLPPPVAPKPRVRIKNAAPNRYVYTPEGQGDGGLRDLGARRKTPAPLSSTRDAETTLNTSGFEDGLQPNSRRQPDPHRTDELARRDAQRRREEVRQQEEERMRHDQRRQNEQQRSAYLQRRQALFERDQQHSCDQSSERDRVQQDRQRQTLAQPERSGSDMSIADAKTAGDLLEAIKLTAQISLNDSRRKADFAFDERAVPDKEAWYMNLPPPWNVLPYENGKYSDELTKMRFTVQNADKPGGHLRLFDGMEADYFEWRPVVIHSIHRRNVSIADKFYYLQMAFKKGEDAFIDGLLREQEPSPEAYEHILEQLEMQFGGERRAYTQAAAALKALPHLDLDSYVSISNTASEVRKYIQFCRRNQMHQYLEPGPTASALINSFMSVRQLNAMIQTCASWGINEATGSFYQIDRYLVRTQQHFAEAREVAGQQKRPSGGQRNRESARGGRGEVSFRGQNRSQPNRGSNFQRGGYNQRGNIAYRGGYGGYNRSRNSSYKPRAFCGTIEEEGEFEKEEEVPDEGYDYPEDLEPEREPDVYDYDPADLSGGASLDADRQLPGTDNSSIVVLTEETVGSEDGYRVFAAVPHEIAVCTLCESKGKKERHFLFACPIFKAYDLKERMVYIRSSERCFNCLGTGHNSRICKSRRSCGGCGKRHHSLICLRDAKPGENLEDLLRDTRPASGERRP